MNAELRLLVRAVERIFSELNAVPSEEALLLILAPEIRKIQQKLKGGGQRKGFWVQDRECTCDYFNCGCRVFIPTKPPEEPLDVQAAPIPTYTSVRYTEKYRKEGAVAIRVKYRIEMRWIA